MTDNAPAAVAVVAAAPRSGWRDILTLALAAVAPAVVVGGALRYDGQRDAQVQENTRRIGTLEHRADKLDEIDRRLARIEGKLDAGGAAKGERP